MPRVLWDRNDFTPLLQVGLEWGADQVGCQSVARSAWSSLPFSDSSKLEYTEKLVKQSDHILAVIRSKSSMLHLYLLNLKSPDVPRVSRSALGGVSLARS